MQEQLAMKTCQKCGTKTTEAGMRFCGMCGGSFANGSYGGAPELVKCAWPGCNFNAVGRCDYRVVGCWPPNEGCMKVYCTAHKGRGNWAGRFDNSCCKECEGNITCCSGRCCKQMGFVFILLCIFFGIGVALGYVTRP